MLALYGSTVYPRCIMWLCMLACYQLSRKKQNKLIHGGFGSIWGDNFYMGMQNGSKLEI